MSLLSPGTLLVNRYRVLRLLGEGGMSEVYLVEDANRPGSRYAAKVLKRDVHQEAGKRFEQEYQWLLGLKHENIVPVYGGYESRGLKFFILGHIEGDSVADRVRKGMLPVVEALRIMKGVLSALDYAHQSGFMHRDVKPSNVLIDLAGKPMLCDFGIARRLGNRSFTRTGTALGTPHYMSPEQIQIPNEVDHRTDLYSAGIVLYEMLTGRVPFGHDATDSEYAILEQQVKTDPPDLRLFNKRLDRKIIDIVEHAMRKKRDKRYQGGLDFRRDIEEYEKSLDPSGRVSQSIGQVAVYEHPGRKQRDCVKLGIAWPALVLGPIWLMMNKLVVSGVLCLVASFVLLKYAQGAHGPGLLLASGVVWGVMPALSTSLLRAWRLKRNGYRFIGYQHQ
jgi:serine/threonine protein kinase